MNFEGEFLDSLLEELNAVGVPPERTLVEQQSGGDEMDLLADISGELAFFELKDKEFSLGNAYSFGAKIGIIRPDHPIIVTTEYVGNDAKEHFQRASRARTSRAELVFQRSYRPISDDDKQTEIRYIEGLANFPEGLRNLARGIYFRDALSILKEVLPLASVDARSLLTSLEGRVAPRETEAARESTSPASTEGKRKAPRKVTEKV